MSVIHLIITKGPYFVSSESFLNLFTKNQKSVKYLVSKSYFTNIKVQIVNKVFDCLH